MADILEVITGIAQAVSAKHEGGTEFGLSRESESLLQGVSIYDPRVIDGFGVQFQGSTLILRYQSEVPIVKVHEKNFETDLRRTIKDISEHIKTEYKKLNKSTLKLTEEGDINITVETVNRRTCFVKVTQKYDIGSIKSDAIQGPESKQSFDITKRWLLNVRGE